MHMDISQFSKREKEVVELLLQGKSNKQIALALGVSQNTVEYHLKNIYKKLRVSSRTEAVLRLGKSVGGDALSKLGESVVDQPGESTENSRKIISRRIPMKNFIYIVAGSLLVVVLVSVLVSIMMPANRSNLEPIVQASLAPVSPQFLLWVFRDGFGDVAGGGDRHGGCRRARAGSLLRDQQSCGCCGQRSRTCSGDHLLLGLPGYRPAHGGSGIENRRKNPL